MPAEKRSRKRTARCPHNSRREAGTAEAQLITRAAKLQRLVYRHQKICFVVYFRRCSARLNLPVRRRSRYQRGCWLIGGRCEAHWNVAARISCKLFVRQRRLTFVTLA